SQHGQTSILLPDGQRRETTSALSQKHDIGRPSPPSTPTLQTSLCSASFWIASASVIKCQASGVSAYQWPTAPSLPSRPTPRNQPPPSSISHMTVSAPCV